MASKEINRWKHNRLIIPMTKEQQDKLLKRLKMKKEYYCSKHGNEGCPDCQECIDNLKRLAEDNNAIIIGDLK